MNQCNSNNQIYHQYNRLVKHLARAYYAPINNNNNTIELEDLEQAGYLGLLHGLKNFKSNKGTKASTYVYNYIRTAITRYIAKNLSIVRMPVRFSQSNFVLDIEPYIDRLVKDKDNISEIEFKLDSNRNKQILEYLIKTRLAPHQASSINEMCSLGLDIPKLNIPIKYKSNYSLTAKKRLRSIIENNKVLKEIFT